MGLAHAFGQKMPFSSLLRFGQNKTKKTLNYFKEKKKKPFLTITKEFFKVQKFPFKFPFRYLNCLNKTRNNAFLVYN